MHSKRYVILAIKITLCWLLLHYFSNAIYYNPSASADIGYYFTYNSFILDHQYQRGDIVLLCLTNDNANSNDKVITDINTHINTNIDNMHNNNTYMHNHLHILYQLGLSNDIHNVLNICGNTSPYLLKQIVAVAGDVVAITANGIFVNGVLYEHSKAQQFTMMHGARVRLFPMMFSTFCIQHGEYFVLGKTHNSYDSRYFGPIWQQQIYRLAVLIYATHVYATHVYATHVYATHVYATHVKY